jgi:hypothetical protein
VTRSWPLMTFGQDHDRPCGPVIQTDAASGPSPPLPRPLSSGSAGLSPRSRGMAASPPGHERSDRSHQRRCPRAFVCARWGPVLAPPTPSDHNPWTTPDVAMGRRGPAAQTNQLSCAVGWRDPSSHVDGQHRRSARPPHGTCGLGCARHPARCSNKVAGSERCGSFGSLQTTGCIRGAAGHAVQRTRNTVL